VDKPRPSGGDIGELTYPMKIKAGSIIRITISFGLLALLFWAMREDIRDMWGTMLSGNLGLVFLGLVLIIVNVTMLAYRLKIIFLGENIDIDMKEAMQLTLVGYFFNNFMPTAVGGDIIKAHYAARASNKRLESYASVMMDRFIGLYTFLIVAAVALFVDRGRVQLEAARRLVYVLLLVGAAGFVAAVNSAVARFLGRSFERLKMFRLGEKLKAVYNIVHDYRNRGGIVAKSFAISIAAQSLYFIVVYLFFLSMGKQVNIGNIFLIMPVVTFVSMLPSIGGLGVREGAFVALFASLTGKELAFAVSLLLLLGLFVVSFLGGMVYLWWGLSGVRTEKAKEIIEKEEGEFSELAD
jgi:uncharacterized protein (TIRG00374 family)